MNTASRMTKSDFTSLVHYQKRSLPTREPTRRPRVDHKGRRAPLSIYLMMGLIIFTGVLLIGGSLRDALIFTFAVYLLAWIAEGM